MELEIIILSEISQTQENNYPMFSLVSGKLGREEGKGGAKGGRGREGKERQGESQGEVEDLKTEERLLWKEGESKRESKGRQT